MEEGRRRRRKGGRDGEGEENDSNAVEQRLMYLVAASSASDWNKVYL